MAKRDKGDKRERPSGVFVRLDPDQLAELEKRRGSTGATIGAQIRIIVRDALLKKGKVIR